MKKTYINPEINLSCFSHENIVTSSGITSTETVSADEVVSKETMTLDWKDFDFTF